MNTRKMLPASVAFSIVFLASAGLGTLSNTIAEASEISGSLSQGSPTESADASTKAPTPIVTSGGSTGPALTAQVTANKIILADGGGVEARPPVGEVLGTSTDETPIDGTSPSTWGWWIWALLGLLGLGVLFLIYSYMTRDENTQRLNSRR